MKEPKQGYAVDQKKLRKFVEKVAKEAKRLFKNAEGECGVEVMVRDRSRHMPHCTIPVPHAHRLETDAEWRRAIEYQLANAESALSALNTTFRLYDIQKNTEDKVAEFSKAMERLTFGYGRVFLTVLYVGPGEPWPRSPDGTRWAFKENLKGSFPHDNSTVQETIQLVRTAIEQAVKSPGPVCFLVSLNTNALLSIFVAVPREEKGTT